MDEEKLNEATGRNTNNEISTRIVKVIDWVMHTDWGRKRRLKGHRQLILLLTLTEGKWHFVFFTRQAVWTVISITGYIRDQSAVQCFSVSLSSYISLRIKTCPRFLIFCTQSLIFVSENTFDVRKISQLQNTNVIFIASPLIFIMYLPTTWSEYEGTCLNW